MNHQLRFPLFHHQPPHLITDRHHVGIAGHIPAKASNDHRELDGFHVTTDFGYARNQYFVVTRSFGERGEL
jgi:hypothetical protein